MTQVTFSPHALEQLCSRICHDLISPVGAINTGAELMTELGMDAGEEAVELIASSAAQAARKLKLFRFAYGAAGSAETVDPRDIRSGITEYFTGSRITFEWSDATLQSFMDMDARPTGLFKLLTLAALQGAECLRKDGKISVSTENNQVRVSLEGQALAFHEGAEDALAGRLRSKDLSPRNINPHIMYKMAQHFEFELRYEYRENSDCSFYITF